MKKRKISYMTIFHQKFNVENRVAKKAKTAQRYFNIIYDKIKRKEK